MTLYDVSTQDDGDAIELAIFCPQEQDMPQVQAGDIVIVYDARTQSRNGSKTSLLKNRQTQTAILVVYDGDLLSKCTSANAVLRARRDQTTPQDSRAPHPNDVQHVFSLYQKLDKTVIPDGAQARASQSLNVQDKFRELKDVEARTFADLIVEVVKQPFNQAFDQGDTVTLWVSDYTQNSAFYDKAADGLEGSGRDGDPYGYTNGFNNGNPSHYDDRQWAGPSGKRSLQVICWEPHAQDIRRSVRAGDWVRLRNVHIKWDRNRTNIEGVLHQDKDYPNRVYVEVLNPKANGETIDPRLKNAIRRKRDYNREHKQKGKGQGKRSAPDGNTKTRRKRSRTEKQKEQQEKEAKAEEQLGLNEHIACENNEQSILRLSDVLRPVPYQTTIDNEPVTLDLPFTNVKFRIQARVVDFQPPNLQDFAIREKRGKHPEQKEYFGEGDESDKDGASSSSDSRIDSEQVDRVGYVWKWQFALKLEEVSPSTSSKTKKKPAASIWVVVDNQDAQLLTNLDAVNLHSAENNNVLAQLTEKMFTLWGNLEECKSPQEAARKRAGLPLGPPPLDSDDEEGESTTNTNAAPASSQLSNKPFRCCLRQYGIKVPTENGEDGDAGEGLRWERVFALFGTKIRGD